MNSTQETNVTETFAYIDVQAIRPSPFNPRKQLGDLDDLAASIAEVGIQQPVVVRPLPGKARKRLTHELVMGHRRHAAAKRAGMKEIPCIVREYSDDQVLAVQIIENNQRADVHPLDEADGFGALVDRGWTLRAIADAVGRSAPYVSQRMQLRQLGDAGREAYAKGQLSLGAAMAIARIPATLQDKATADLIDDAGVEWSESGMVEQTQSVAAVSGDYARKFLQREFMLSLAEAPFPIDDANLVPTAGPCTTCPKMTGSQAALFADLAGDNRCTDSTCFRAKADAQWARLEADASVQTLDEEESQRALCSYDHRRKFVMLDDIEFVPSGDPENPGEIVRKTVEELLKDHDVVTALARHPDTGRHFTVVDRSTVDSIVNELHGRDESTSTTTRNDSAQKERERKERLKAKQDARELELCIVEALRLISEPGATDLESAVGYAIELAVPAFWNDLAKVTLKRREVEIPKHAHGYGLDVEGALRGLVMSLDHRGRIGVLLELGLRRHGLTPPYGSTVNRFDEVLDALGVDRARLKRQAADELKPKRKAKPTKAAA